MKICRIYITTVVVLAMTSLSVIVAIAKTELIANGTFEADTSGWDPSNSKAILTRITSDFHSGTASLEVKNTSLSGSTVTNGAIQCINLAPVENYYTVEGWVKVPSQTNNTTEAFIRFRFYDIANCVTAIGSNQDTTVLTENMDWTSVSTTANTPTGAESVQVRLYVRKGGNTGDAYAYFDDISFFPSTATVVTLSSFTARSGQSVPQSEQAVILLLFQPVATLLSVGIVAIVAGLTLLRRRRPH